MKNKVIVICVCILILCFSFSMYSYENKFSKNRYHEHILSDTSFDKYDYSNINYDTFQSESIQLDGLSTHLPVISFDTNGQEILGGTDKTVKDYIKVSMDVYDEKTSGVTDLKESSYDTKALIRYRGNSSRLFEKKGLRLKLVNSKDEEKPYKLLGLSKDSDFVLHGPYLDKTLIRNYLGYNLTGEVMEYSPNVRFTEVFVNGEYQGVFLLVENIKVSKNRINISKLQKNSSVSSYLLEITPRRDGEDIEYLNNFTYNTNRIYPGSQYNIKYPNYGKLSDDINDYINDDLSYFERILYSFDYDDENFGYMNYIDIDSFVNYVVFNEFFLNYDAGNNSTYVYKDKTGKLKLAFWDMNNIFDNYFVDLSNENGFMMQNKSWFSMFLKDEYFTDRVISRYKELRKGILSEDYLYSYIDDTVNYLNDAIFRNFVRWGDSFSDEKNLYIDVSRNSHSYEEAISDLKKSIHERGIWLDKNIESLRQFSHESKVKDFNP